MISLKFLSQSELIEMTTPVLVLIGCGAVNLSRYKP